MGGTLQGRVALVTGSSRGIGAAIARKLAAESADVAIHGSKSVDQARALADEISAGGRRARVLTADLASLDGPSQLVRAAFEAYGNVDILVNNAGVFDSAPVDSVREEQIDRILFVNVRAVVLATREFARLTRSRHGRIVNISSIAARMATAGSSVYGASKAAVEALTRSHAVELGARRITVNCVAPGTTETAMSATGFTPEAREAIAAASPLGRLGRPEDIAEVVAFLSSDGSGWITGQVIGADGGQPTSAKTLMHVFEIARRKA